MFGKANSLFTSFRKIRFRLALPLVIRETVNILHPGANYAETTDLSTFGFLYGTFPSGKKHYILHPEEVQTTTLLTISMKLFQLPVRL